MLSVVQIRKNISLVETGDLWVSKQTVWCTKYRESELYLFRSCERYVGRKWNRVQEKLRLSRCWLLVVRLTMVDGVCRNVFVEC
jgi:hypothetical protein